MRLRIAREGHETIEHPMVSADRACLADLISLKVESGIGLRDIEKLSEDEADPTMVAIGVYLTLRHAGSPMRWADVTHLPIDSLDFVPEPGDEPEEEAQDPPQAPPDSGLDGADGASTQA
jgi:hypothetical protein